MVSFAQPLFWQIRYLVSNLSKKNYKSSVAELHHLVCLYGYDAQVFLVRALIEEVQFQDAKHSGGGGGRDQLKTQLLQNEIKELETEEQFGTLLCQAVEACKKDGGLSEELLSSICRVARVPLRGQLALGVACLQSTSDATRREGAKYLRGRVREFAAPGGKHPRLPETLLHQLLAALRGPELEEALEEKDRDALFKQLVDLHPGDETSRGACVGLLQFQRMSFGRIARHERRPVVAAVPLLASAGTEREGVRACDLLEEIGPCAGGASAARDVLALFPGIGARGLAEIVCMVVRTAGAPADPNATLAAGALAAATSGSWVGAGAAAPQQAAGGGGDAAQDAATAVEALRAASPDAPWEEVFDVLFDLPDLSLSGPGPCQALLGAHAAALGGRAPFPLRSVLRLRRNTAAQLQFLRFAASCADLDFAAAEPSRTLDPAPGVPGAEDLGARGGPSACWACGAFVEVLLELAEVEDYGAVLELFEAPAAEAPQAALLAVCTVEDRSRGALRAELLSRLVPPLFEGVTRPAPLVKALAERAPDQLRRLLREMVEKDPERGTPRVAEALQGEGMSEFRSSLTEGPPTELSCQLAILGDGEGAPGLAEWLRSVLERHKDAAALALARFLRRRLGTAGEAAPPALPSWADEQALCKSFLEALSEAAGSLGPEASRRVRELEQLAQQRHPSLAPAPAVQPPSAAPAAGPVPPSAPPPPPAERPPAQQQNLSPEDLEESSNSYFSRIYTGEMTVPQLVEVMKDFASHEKGNWKHEVYSRMISNLFDECRFFPKYPPQELTITGELFGLLIKNDLVHTSNLGLALRCVLEALRRPMHTKMFKFGILALEQFLDRLPVWPALCQHLTQIQDLSEAYPTYVQYVKDILNALPEELRNATPGPQLSALKQETLQNYQMPPPPPKLSLPPALSPPSAPPPAAGAAAAAREPPSSAAPPPQPPPAAPPPPSGAKTPPPTSSPPAGPPPPPFVPPPSAPEEGPPAAQPAAAEAKAPPAVAAPAAATAPAAAAAAVSPSAAGAMGGSLMFGATAAADSLLSDPDLQLERPAAWVQDAVAAIFNSLVKDNLEAKAEEMRSVVQPEHHAWLAHYLVKNRASREVNFHPTYIEFFEKLRLPRLMDTVTNMTYECLRVLLKSVDQAVVSTSHRTVLKNLGYWLGQITLGRSKPLKGKHVDLKALLLEAYENGRLTAVLPLVCKVLEGVQKSRAYKLPNPWTAAVMSLLAEIHDVPNLRTNLMFEVEVLCKHLDIKISDLKRSDLLAGRPPPSSSNDLSSAARQPAAEAKPDAGTKDSVAAAAASAAPTSNLRGDAAAWPGAALPADMGKEAGYHSYGSGAGQSLLPLLPGAPGSATAPSGAASGTAGSATAGHQEDFIVPQLPNHVAISPTITLFQTHPQLRSVVPLAVDRAIREVISAVVERSVNISCWTTREMVTKDFAMDPDENVLKKAAELMVSSLASSLALVTCREPLRVSLTNHLWTLLQNCVSKDMTEFALDQVVHVLSTENLELGCNLIEQAVVEKARKDIDESIAPAIQARREQKARNPNVPFYDASYFHGPQNLPEMLRPKPGPISSGKLKVYTDFNNMPLGKARPPSSVPSAVASSMPALATGAAAAGGSGAAAASAALAAPAPTAPPQEPPPPLLPTPGLGQQALGQTAASGGEAAGQQHAASQPSGASPRAGEAEAREHASAAAAATGLSQDAQASLGAILGKVEESVRALLADLPPLPPVDPVNPAAYKQDDALDACAALAALPLDHVLLTTLREVPQLVARPEALATELAHLMFRQLYEAAAGRRSGRRRASRPAPAEIPHMHPPDTISPLHAVLEAYLAVLGALKPALEDRLSKVLTSWVDDVQGPQRYSVHAVAGLLRCQLVGAADMDRVLARWIGRETGAMNAQAVDFAVMLLQRACILQQSAAGADFPETMEVLAEQVRLVLQQQAVAEQQAKTIADGKAAAAARGLNPPATPQEPQWPQPQDLHLAEAAGQLLEKLRAESQPSAPLQALNERLADRIEEEQRKRSAGHQEAAEAISREVIITVFDEWHKVFDASPDASVQGQASQAGCSQVLQRICTTFARSDEHLERFFRICCGYAVGRAVSDSPLAEAPVAESTEEEDGIAETQTPMNFAVIDSFTRLAYCMMKCLDKVQILTRALGAITKELQKDAADQGSSFNQRPYYRVFLNLLTEVSAPDPKLEQAGFQLLCAFCNTFLQVNPLRLPNFAFAWLDLISNRMFMPKLLNRKGPPTARLMFQRLLVQLLYVMEPYLRRVQLTTSTRLLYKGTMRMLLVLLHDFPEFLCDYHFAFCDLVPIPCVQIRNLILSAFPRDMRLPDPFEPNLKVDRLPEIGKNPKILADYQSTLLHQGLKADVDAYMRTRDRRLLETIKEKLRLPEKEREAMQLESPYNVPLLNALLLYVGVSLPNKQGGATQNNPVEIFMFLVQQFDYEGRYLFLSAIANHLRYPNAHTHLFSCIMLYLFDGTTDMVVREQITRVLLERLIVHRPHPWGLLITFIELIRNSRYAFWSHSFVNVAPEIEKLFHSVALTWNCGPGTAAS